MRTVKSVVSIDIYRVAIVVAANCSVEEAKRFTKKRFKVNDFDIKPCSGVVIAFDTGVFLLYLPTWKSDTWHFNTLGHECLHLTHGILKRANIHERDGEVEAYLLGYVQEKVLGKLI